MRVVRSGVVMLAMLLVLATASVLSAAQITSFGQVGTLNQFIATNNGNGTTSLDATGTVDITNIISGATDDNALFTFEAESIDAAQLLVGTVITQHYAGTFSLTNQAGTFNYLSGTFGGALQVGGNGGTGSLIGANSAGLGPLSFTTDLPVLLLDPKSFGLALSNLTPPLSIENGSIGSFTASYVGTADANVEPIPEPATMTMLGLGLVGMGGALRRRLRR